MRAAESHQMADTRGPASRPRSGGWRPRKTHAMTARTRKHQAEPGPGPAQAGEHPQAAVTDTCRWDQTLVSLLQLVERVVTGVFPI